MINEDKKYILKMQNIIDIILEKQNDYAIDRDVMFKLNDFFSDNADLFDNNFIVSYLDFIEVFNPFFDMLINRLKACENTLLEEKDLVNGCYFTFNFSEFKDKDSLIPYSDMLSSLEEMFPKNVLLQGLVFFIHLNTLLKRYKFLDNKIRLVNKLPVIDIDYGSRISYFKEEYVTEFRHELEEGIRVGVFLDEDEIIKYVMNEIDNLESKFYD